MQQGSSSKPKTRNTISDRPPWIGAWSTTTSFSIISNNSSARSPTPSISRRPSIASPTPSQLAKQRNIVKPKITTPSPLSKPAAVRTTGNSSSAVASNIQNPPKNTRGSVRNSSSSTQRKPAAVSKKTADQPRPPRHPQTIPPKLKPSLEKKTPVKKTTVPTINNKNNGSSNNNSNSRRSSSISTPLPEESSPALILRFVTPARVPVPATTNPTDSSSQQTPQEDKPSPRAVVAVSFENAALTSQQMESFWEQHERDYARSIHSVHSAYSANTVHNPRASLILSSTSPSSSSASTSSSSSSTNSLPATTVQDPERDDASDRATIRSRTQSSPAHDLVAKIMERNAPQPQRSSIGGFMDTWTTKASSLFSSSTRKDTAKDSNNSNGSSSNSINTANNASVISSLTASISPSLTKSLAVSVSSIESFPSQDPSPRRVRSIRNLFRASVSTPQAFEPQESNRKEESIQESMTSTVAPSATVHTTEAASVTDKEEDKSDSRRNSLMSIFPVVFQKKTHLRVVTSSSSGQDSMHGSQSSLSTPLYSSEGASQNSSSPHSNMSSACPSPIIQQKIHPLSSVPIVQSPLAQQKKNASDETLATTMAQHGQKHVQERQENSSCNTSEVSIATAKPTMRPAPLSSMTMVNEIWHDHQPAGQKVTHAQGAFPTQQHNTTQAGETTTSSFRSTGESSEWPWMHPEKDKWNTTYVSAHKGLLLMPPTYSPASEMDDPIASYNQSPSGAPVSVTVMTATAGDTIAADAGAHGSLEAGVGVRFGGPVGSLENNDLMGSKVSGHTYF